MVIDNKKSPQTASDNFPHPGQGEKMDGATSPASSLIDNKKTSSPKTASGNLTSIIIEMMVDKNRS